MPQVSNSKHQQITITQQDYEYMLEAIEQEFEYMEVCVNSVWHYVILEDQKLITHV